MIRKLILIGGAAALAAATPVAVLAATSANGAPGGTQVTCTGDQQRLQLHDQQRLQDGTGSGVQARVGTPATADAGGTGWVSGPADGSGLQHQGPAGR